MINRNKKSTSAYTIKQLNDAIKDIDDCISILSRQFLPENVLKYTLHGIGIYLDILSIRLCVKEIVSTKDNTAYIMLAFLIMVFHVLVIKIMAEQNKSIRITYLSESDQTKIKNSIQHLGINNTTAMSSMVLKDFNHKKSDFKKILVEANAWHTFSMYNRREHRVS